MNHTIRIIIHQNPNLQQSQIVKLYKRLMSSNWTVESRHEEGKICYSESSDSEYTKLDFKTGLDKFEGILQNAESHKKWIGFLMSNEELNRSTRLSHQADQYVFELEINKEDDPYEWLRKFHRTIAPSVKKDFSFHKIEWKDERKNKISRVETALYHEGVLILASSNQLKEYFS
ncbi:MAG: hypothetical protein AAFV95_24680, partial [Bacteroidota bacterium]